MPVQEISAGALYQVILWWVFLFLIFFLVSYVGLLLLLSVIVQVCVYRFDERHKKKGVR